MEDGFIEGMVDGMFVVGQFVGIDVLTKAIF